MSYNLVQQNPETGELYLKNIAGGGGSDIEQFIGTTEEWEALSEEEKNKYIDREVILTDDGSGSSGGKDIYSEEETIVGTWIDGKPIYRKCFKYSGSLNESVANAGTVTNVKDLIELKLCGNLTDNYLFAGSMTRDNNTSNPNNTFAFLQKSNGSIYIGHYGANGITNGNWTIIVEYTKTTD